MNCPLKVIRYHSLVINTRRLPATFEVTAWTLHNEIMGIKHRVLPIKGVQFHPESILSEQGRELLNNFLSKKV